MRLLLVSLGFILLSCGGKNQDKKSSPYERKKTEVQHVKPRTPTEIVDLKNIGLGPITDLHFSSEIDQILVTNGKELFDQKCRACHKPKTRFIGPALSGIYERRNPAWVMNIMLNPEEMLKKDSIASKLLEQYNNVIMFDQDLTKDEARALAEYFRIL